MKINTLYFLLLMLVFPNLWAQEVALSPMADTFVSKSSAETNYGSDDNLLIKGSTNGNFDRKTFLKFDLTDIGSDYEQILLRGFKAGGEEVELITNSTATAWDEETMTWSNAPDPIKEVGQGNIRSADTIYIDVTDYIKSKIDNDQLTVSLQLSSTSIVGSPFKLFSKESADASLHPKLLFFKKPKISTIEKIELSRHVSSNMVIQRSQAFPFKGTGPAGKTVQLDFEREGKQTVLSSTIDANGKFSIPLPAQEATVIPCTATLEIEGFPETKLILDNILIGDVWFAGGQSNMEKRVDYMLQAEEIMADADNYKNIRAFRAEYNAEFDPKEEVKAVNANWFVCDSDNVDRISAVAYIFAKEINREIGVPIGIMASYVGGTEIESWISEDKIENDPDLQFVEDRLPDYDPEDPKAYQRYPSINYNGMVNPLRYFPITGFLFYQGESNVKRAPEYGTLLTALIEDYREKWQLGNLPFYYVQLPNIGITSERNYEVKSDDNTWQMLREQQRRVLQDGELTNLGMAVIIETNEEHLNSDPNVRIHPRNKKPVGERLANIALKKEYQLEDVALSPLPGQTWVKGDSIYVRFDNTADGLKVRTESDELKGFAIAGTDGVFYEGAASIAGNNIVKVFNAQVNKPQAIAYGWSRDPLSTLDNSADLPASPFKISDVKAIAFMPAEDAYIKEGSESGVNFGSAPELFVQSSAKSYLKFDLSSTDFESITSARLMVFGSAAAETLISASATSTIWAENDIIWDNAPVPGQELSTTTIQDTEMYYEWNLSDQDMAAVDDQGILSLVLTTTADAVSTFNSTENQFYKPFLVVNGDGATMGISKNKSRDSKITLYPNPAKDGKVTANFNGYALKTIEDAHLIDVLGRSYSLNQNPTGSAYEFDVSAIPSGIYILSINTLDERFTGRVIIE